MWLGFMKATDKDTPGKVQRVFRELQIVVADIQSVVCSRLVAELSFPRREENEF